MRDSGTSMVVMLIPAGFHLFRFQPSTHIAPRLIKLTVPSPSPILTPFLTFHNEWVMEYQNALIYYIPWARMFRWCTPHRWSFFATGVCAMQGTNWYTLRHSIWHSRHLGVFHLVQILLVHTWGYEKWTRSFSWYWNETIYQYDR